jgi:hypothetical protein
MKDLVQRFKEPSSWAGIAVLVNVMAPMIGIPPGVGDAVVAAGTGIAGLLAFFLKENV